MEIHWSQASAARGYYRAFRIIEQELEAADSDFAELVDAAKGVRAALRAELVEPPAFLEQWMPLVARGVPPRDASAIALTKLTPGGSLAGSKTGDGPACRLAPVFQALDALVRGQLDPLADGAVTGEAQAAWLRHGPALLARLGQITEPGLIADRAEVHIVVAGAESTGGVAFLAHNLVFWELVPRRREESGHAPDDVLTLAWLLGTLQQDLPGYVENLARAERCSVPRLALVPAILAARVSDEPATADAIRSFLVTRRLANGQEDVVADLLAHWWRTYEAQRPAWPIALSALAVKLANILADGDTTHC